MLNVGWWWDLIIKQLQSSLINLVHIVEVLCAGMSRYVQVDVVYVPFPGKGTYTTSTGTAPAHLHYVHQIN
jgi:hypothetical protein